MSHSLLRVDFDDEKKGGKTWVLKKAGERNRAQRLAYFELQAKVVLLVKYHPFII